MGDNLDSDHKVGWALSLWLGAGWISATGSIISWDSYPLHQSNQFSILFVTIIDLVSQCLIFDDERIYVSENTEMWIAVVSCFSEYIIVLKLTCLSIL